MKAMGYLESYTVILDGSHDLVSKEAGMMEQHRNKKRKMSEESYYSSRAPLRQWLNDGVVK